MNTAELREKAALRGDERGTNNVGETSGTQMEMAREDQAENLRGLSLLEK